MDSIVDIPTPINEPVRDYAPGSPERASLQAALADLAAHPADLPHIIIFNPDQWRGDVLGHVGNPAAVTPHLDEMQNPGDVHFNAAGYEFLGQRVAEAIGKEN